MVIIIVLKISYNYLSKHIFFPFHYINYYQRCQYFNLLAHVQIGITFYEKYEYLSCPKRIKGPFNYNKNKIILIFPFRSYTFFDKLFTFYTF